MKRSVEELLADIDELVPPVQPSLTLSSTEGGIIFPDFAKRTADKAEAKLDNVLYGNVPVEQLLYLHEETLRPDRVGRSELRYDAVISMLADRGLAGVEPAGNFATAEFGGGEAIWTSFQRLGKIASIKSWAVIMGKVYERRVPDADYGDSVEGREIEILAFSGRATQDAIAATKRVPQYTIGKFIEYRDELKQIA